MGNLVSGLFVIWAFPVLVYAFLSAFNIEVVSLHQALNNPISLIVGSALKIALMLWVLIKAAETVGFLSKENKFDIKYEMKHVQAFIAVVVVFAFALAAITGQVDGANALKDLALVVVGFYFGTKLKDGEDVKWLVKDQDSKDK